MFCHSCGFSTRNEDNFCGNCGISLLPISSVSSHPQGCSYDDLLKHYFGKDYTNQEIVRCLSEYHDVHVSIRTVKRDLKRLELRRRASVTPHLLTSATNVISAELRGSGRQMGYRLMTKTLRLKYNMRIPMKRVMEILRATDYTSVLLRQRHVLRRRTYTALGPNYMWHADGHDKLKKYGIAIHACIDGYSRRVLWVSCASSNNDPSVIAYYYVSTVRELGGCAHILRTDCGTENVVMATMQCEIRNSLRAHTYGTSPHNQRIESWWCYLRKMKTQWWIEFFDDLEQANVLNIDKEQHVECIRFCFMNVILHELVEAKMLWNNHRIRPSRGARCPGGIPDHLFFTPGRAALQCKVPVNDDLCALLMHRCSPPKLCQDSDFEAVLQNLCVSNSLSPNPRNPEEALALFTNLKALLNG